jgi:hypothetical protein
VERLARPFLCFYRRVRMDYIGVRGVDGPDSTGVSTDAQAHARAFRLRNRFVTPHPDMLPATRRLAILVRYGPLACSLISGSLGDVVETKGAGRMNGGGGGRVSGGAHSAPACTMHVHTILQLATLATTTTLSKYYTHLHATLLWLKHTWRLYCGHWAATGPAGTSLEEQGGEQALYWTAIATLYCKAWWWRSTGAGAMFPLPAVPMCRPRDR